MGLSEMQQYTLFSMLKLAKGTPNYTHVQNPIFDKRNSLTRNTTSRVNPFQRRLLYITHVFYDFAMDLCF